MIDTIKKIYYTCSSVADEAQLSFYSGIIPENHQGVSYFPISQEVEQIAREFEIALTLVGNRAFTFDGSAYRIAWYESHTFDRCPVLIRADIELEQDDFSYYAPMYCAKAEIDFGISWENGLLYNQNEERIDDNDLSTWVVEWKQEIKEAVDALLEIEGMM